MAWGKMARLVMDQIVGRCAEAHTSRVVKRRRASVWVKAALLVGLLMSPGFSRAQEIRYVYDDLNRLVGVVDQQGNAAEYVYDAVGNLLQIKRFDVPAGASLAITLVRPTKGTVGTTVQLFGKGFSSTPGQNAVTFSGGATAPVTAATSTSLTTTVPPGATTGLITVTTPLGTATSPEPFSVLQGFAVIPDQADVALGGTVGFRATLGGTPTSAVTWRVNGTIGGSATLGTISAAGLYTSPASPPLVQPILVEAVLTADPSQVATATVRVVGQVAGLIAASPVSVGSAAAVAAQTLSGPVSVGVTQATGAQALAGPVTVAVTPATGAQALSGPLSVTGGPVVTGLTPATGGVGSSLGVSLTGANLQGATAIQALRNGLWDTTLTASAVTPAPDGTTVTFTLTISPSAPAGSRVLQVVTPQGRSTNFDLGANRFTVTNP